MLIVALAALLYPRTAQARWTRVTTEHFVFVGDASEASIRSIAGRLEMFHEVIGRVLPGQPAGTPIPTVVLVFQNARSLAPFRPMFQGKPVELAGFFAGSEDANYIAVNAEQETNAYSVIFHEYAHSLTANALGDIPLWASEGLAELYETFAATGGRSATLGKPNLDNLRLLQQTTLLPFEQLIEVVRDSPMYNEGNRRGRFYATSWAFVHYLTFGGPERSAQWQAFLSSAAQGVDGALAFAEAFGRDTSGLERDLRNYVRQNLKELRIDFDERIVTSAATRGMVIADGEAAGYLGELMAYTGRVDDARMYLRKAIDAGGSPRAAGALGRLELRAGNEDLALSLLEQAVSGAPTWPLRSVPTDKPFRGRRWGPGGRPPSSARARGRRSHARSKPSQETWPPWQRSRSSRSRHRPAQKEL